VVLKVNGIHVPGSIEERLAGWSFTDLCQDCAIQSDPWAYQKLEHIATGTVLEQKVNLEPTADWSDNIDQGESMYINQSGYGCAYCGKGFLAQSGIMYGDNVTAWQAGLIDGNTGYSEISQKNTPDWVKFSQIASFNME
jgi:hypothetical protein